MKSLTLFSIAALMAFALSGPVTLTTTPAHAGDGWDCFVEGWDPGYHPNSACD
ncbi:MAG: hypothetical protein V6Z81_08250 [Parvularculales bacterium]